MKKILIYLVLSITLLCSISSVSAECYKVTNNNNGSVSYTTYADPAQRNDSKYTVESVGDDKCNGDSEGKINFDNKVSCGNMGQFNKKLPEITSWIVTVAEILVPVLLVIFGSIDFVKGIISQKEDEIKKGQQVFIKRLITAIIVFFIVAFTKLIVSAVSGDGEGFIDCIDCFISNKCS